MSIRVHLLPQLTTPQAVAGRRVAVLDVLRATTTICYALAAGARSIQPVREIGDARELARQRSDWLLGGERGGLKPPDFDLGNSPAEYTPDTVGQRDFILTTTNGAKALEYCLGAEAATTVALVNRTAVAHWLTEFPECDLICSGTDGAITREDVLGAGAVLEVWLAVRGASAADLVDDSARLALAAWLDATGGNPDRVSLAQVLAETQGGRNLIARGLGSDLPLAAALDRFALVPHFDLGDWQIRRGE